MKRLLTNFYTPTGSTRLLGRPLSALVDFGTRADLLPLTGQHRLARLPESTSTTLHQRRC